jgi:hypothetical protein
MRGTIAQARGTIAQARRGGQSDLLPASTPPMPAPSTAGCPARKLARTSKRVVEARVALADEVVEGVAGLGGRVDAPRLVHVPPAQGAGHAFQKRLHRDGGNGGRRNMSRA